MNNQLQEVLANLVKQLGDAATKYGPQAIDMAGHYLQLKAIIDLIGSVVLIVAVLVGMKILCRLVKFLAPLVDDSDFNYGFVLAAIVGIVGGIGLLITAICAVNGLIDPTIWLPALSPKMALVQQALTAVSASK